MMAGSGSPPPPWVGPQGSQGSSLAPMGWVPGLAPLYDWDRKPLYSLLTFMSQSCWFVNSWGGHTGLIHKPTTQLKPSKILPPLRNLLLSLIFTSYMTLLCCGLVLLLNIFISFFSLFLLLPFLLLFSLIISLSELIPPFSLSHIIRRLLLISPIRFSSFHKFAHLITSPLLLPDSPLPPPARLFSVSLSSPFNTLPSSCQFQFSS